MLGSRVRTVFEDGEEYEGTILTVHYRVTYDKDGDTKTFVDETQVFESLACNDKYLEGPVDDGIRCSVLELFSGEPLPSLLCMHNTQLCAFSLWSFPLGPGFSLLLTLCKRRGMNVVSVGEIFPSQRC